MSMGAIPVEDADYYGIVQTRGARLWEEEGRKCHWCGTSTVLTKHAIPNQATEDHIIPRSSGGSNTDENIVSACLKCNARRNKEHEEGLPEGALLRKVVRTNYTRVSPEELKIEYLTKSLSIAKTQYEHLKTENQQLRRFLHEAPFWEIVWARWRRKERAK